MKYLKSLNESYTEEQVENLYTPLINQEMINDLKEMSLEYLDEGVTLEICIQNSKLYNVLCFMYYNHQMDTSVWYRCDYSYDIPNKDSIRYRIKFIVIDMVSSYKEKERSKYEEDVLERIKSIYPDENINLFYPSNQWKMN